MVRRLVVAFLVVVTATGVAIGVTSPVSATPVTIQAQGLCCG